MWRDTSALTLNGWVDSMPPDSVPWEKYGARCRLLCCHLWTKFFFVVVIVVVVVVAVVVLISTRTALFS